jgi:hypothetical protein
MVGEKKDETLLVNHSGYQFQPVGAAAGHDGMLELREYDWSQISIVEFSYQCRRFGAM